MNRAVLKDWSQVLNIWGLIFPPVTTTIILGVRRCSLVLTTMASIPLKRFYSNIMFPRSVFLHLPSFSRYVLFNCISTFATVLNIREGKDKNTVGKRMDPAQALSLPFCESRLASHWFPHTSLAPVTLCTHQQAFGLSRDKPKASGIAKVGVFWGRTIKGCCQQRGISREGVLNPLFPNISW